MLSAQYSSRFGRLLTQQVGDMPATIASRALSTEHLKAHRIRRPSRPEIKIGKVRVSAATTVLPPPFLHFLYLVGFQWVLGYYSAILSIIAKIKTNSHRQVRLVDLYSLSKTNGILAHRTREEPISVSISLCESQSVPVGLRASSELNRNFRRNIRSVGRL